MYFKAFRPSAALEPYIRSYYYLQIDTDEKAMGQITRYPTDGGPKLVINLGDAFLAGDNQNNLKSFTGCRLIGSLSRQLISKTGGRIAFLAIRFMPGKIAPFFNVRGSELTDGSAALDALWGTYGKEFEQRLCNFDTIQLHKLSKGGYHEEKDWFDCNCMAAIWVYLLFNRCGKSDKE